MEGEDETHERPFVEDHQSPTVLPWDQFSNWIHCCCVVTFDLELGQAMEVILLALILSQMFTLFLLYNIYVLFFVLFSC